MESLTNFPREYILLIIAFVFLILLLRLIRRWPDRAKKVFLQAGIRASEQQVKDLRSDLAEIAAESGRQALRAVTQQQLKIENIKHERERIKHLVHASPRLVKEVGDALVTLEKEYSNCAKKVKSESAKEVLRIAAEKGMNDIVQAVGNGSSKLPPFNVPDD